MKNTVELMTDRLHLRKIKSDDYKEIFECWTSNPEVCKYVTWDIHKTNTETKEIVDLWINEYANDYTFRWLVTLKYTKEIIGMIDVINKNIQYMTAEIGYCYGQKYWGKGYATEALTKVIDFLHSVGFATVYAEHFKSNIASGKVMEKAGMQYEATLRSRVINKFGKREDVCVYSSVIDSDIIKNENKNILT